MQQSQPSGSFSAQGSQRFVATATGVAVFATIAAQQANFRACMGANGWMLGQANQQQIQAPQQVNNAGAVVVTPPPPLSAQTTPPPPAAPVVPVHEKLEATTVCDQARDHTNVYRRLGCDLRDKEQEDQVRQDINREEAYNDTHGPSAN